MCLDEKDSVQVNCCCVFIAWKGRENGVLGVREGGIELLGRKQNPLLAFSDYEF